MEVKLNRLYSDHRHRVFMRVNDGPLDPMRVGVRVDELCKYLDDIKARSEERRGVLRVIAVDHRNNRVLDVFTWKWSKR